MIVSPIGFGSFKIGRNTKIKYAAAYDLPSDSECQRLLFGLLEMGINLIDTAPAYGIAEERLGKLLASRRSEFLLSTKAGEEFDGVSSRYDFSRDAIMASAHRSLKRLRCGHLDFLMLHTNGDAERAGLDDAIVALHDLKAQGLVRAIGISPTLDATALAAATWADVLMLEINPDRQPPPEIVASIAARGIAVFAKKALSSGHASADSALRQVLGFPYVTSAVVGSLSLEHMRENLNLACSVRAESWPSGCPHE